MKNVLLMMMFLGGFGGSVHTTEALAADESAEASEEIYAGEINPFKKEIKKVDPLSHQKVDQVLIGPVYKAKRGSNFNFYRYVTFYNVSTRKERIYSLPTHREQCFDKSELFASYTYTYTRSAKVGATLEFQGLGLSADLTESHTFTTGRNINALGVEIVDHTPYLYKADWDGFSYLETINTATGKEEFVVKKGDHTPFWLSILFPKLAATSYPMPFSVKDADWTFVVERVVIGPCSTH